MYLNNKKTKNDLICVEIERLMNMGMTDKEEIFQRVVIDLNVPRPTVRRIARDMRTEMLRKVKILQSELDLEKNV